MRLNLILPVVDPEKRDKPKECAHEGCKGKQFKPKQEVEKRVRDSEYSAVKAMRYECKRCGRTFRVYPQGVQSSQLSQRVKGIGVMLYILGLSYGAVALMMEALGIYMSKSSVYRAVQATGEAVPGMKQRELLGGYRTRAMGGDVTGVKCRGKWLPIGVTVDAQTGWVLSIDKLSGEDAETIEGWIRPIAKAVGAYTLVSDDADVFKGAADRNGMDHQVCKSHVVRNTETLTRSLRQIIEAGKDTSLKEIGIEPNQALVDLERLDELIHARQPEGQGELQDMYERYAPARAPRKGKQASVKFPFRLSRLHWGMRSMFPR